MIKLIPLDYSNKLFNNLSLCGLVQRKRTAHERAKELFASGEFSSGRKWADDAPKEKLDTNTVNLIASGACGAFVHGLEDEMFGMETTQKAHMGFNRKHQGHGPHACRLTSGAVHLLALTAFYVKLNSILNAV